MIPRIMMHIAFLLVGLLLMMPQAQAKTVPQILLTRIIPTQLEDQIIYPTNHAIIAYDPWQAYHWKEITLPLELVRPGVYVELWDSSNHRVPGFGAQPLRSPTMDVSKIDATLYPSIRVVLFDANKQFQLGTTLPVYFSYTQTFNIRLLLFVSFFVVLICGVCIQAHRLHLSLLATARQIVRLPATATMTQYTLAAMGCLMVFAVALGWYTGIEQIVYLTMKLPVLLYGSLVISGLAVFLCLNLLTIRESWSTLLRIVSRSLLHTSVLLASLSPLVLFYILYPFSHDQLLTMIMLLFIIAAGGGVITLAQHTYRLTQRVDLVTITVVVWFLVYGSVLTQLGWMLRPWVGIRDPVQHTVPFARPYSGNVFTEIIQTMRRL